MKIKNIRSIILFFAFCILFSCGDDTKVVAGFVSTEDGEPAQGIVVVVVGDDEDSEPENVITDEEGWYSYEHQELAEGEKVTIAPSDPDYEFSPEKYLTDGGNSELDLDFVAVSKK